jgi:hypothetical protein
VRYRLDIQLPAQRLEKAKLGLPPNGETTDEGAAVVCRVPLRRPGFAAAGRPDHRRQPALAGGQHQGVEHGLEVADILYVDKCWFEPYFLHHTSGGC